MKIVAIGGIERCDIAYHVSRALAKESNLVIAVDNSYDKELYNTVEQKIHTDEEETYIVKRSDIMFLKDTVYTPSFFEAFEYVVFYMGMHFDEEMMDKADHLFLMPDYRPSTIRAFQDIPGKYQKKAEYILRDRTGKIGEKAAALMLGTTPDNVVGALDYNEQDYTCYLSLLHNGRQKVAKHTNEYKSAIAYITARAMDTTVKNAMKIVKRSRG